MCPGGLEDGLPLCIQCWWNHTLSQFWASHYKQIVQYIELLECREQQQSSWVKGLENKIHGEWLRELRLFSLEKKSLRGDLTVFHNYLKWSCSEEGVDLFSQVTSDRMWGNSLRLLQGRFRLVIKKNFSMGRVAKHWNTLPKKCWSLWAFNKCMDMALRYMV